MLAGSDPSSLLTDSGVVAAVDAATTDSITQIVLRVGSQTHTLTTSNSTVEIAAGEQWTVEGVQFQTGLAVTAEDRFALEGYVRVQPADASTVPDFDYAHGRYGAAVEVPAGEFGGMHPGLDDGWEAVAGQNRLSLSLIRYAPDAENGAVVGRYFVDLQVGAPTPETDFVFRGGQVLKPKVGEPTTILGTWLNAGHGHYENYAEVNVYRKNDLTMPIWVGTLSGVSGDGGVVMGEFLNNRSDDPFTERWEPKNSGDYLVRFYADPENVWNESDEANNMRELVVRVNGKSDKKGIDYVFGQLGQLSPPASLSQLYHALDESYGDLFEALDQQDSDGAVDLLMRLGGVPLPPPSELSGEDAVATTPVTELSEDSSSPLLDNSAFAALIG
jgi:hypothetical protein